MLLATLTRGNCIVDVGPPVLWERDFPIHLPWIFARLLDSNNSGAESRVRTYRALSVRFTVGCPSTQAVSANWLRRWELHPQSPAYEAGELLFLYRAIIITEEH